MSDRLTPASESLLRDMNRHDRGWARERLHTVEAEAAARALDEVLSVENVARALHETSVRIECRAAAQSGIHRMDHEQDAAALIAAVEARAIEGSGVGHEPVLFDPTGPVYDSLPHPKASRYELSGALLRDQSADPLADPDAYDRRILLVTVASAARALAALSRPEEPRVERCAVCGVGRWVIAHDPEAGPSYHPFAEEDPR